MAPPAWWASGQVPSPFLPPFVEGAVSLSYGHHGLCLGAAPETLLKAGGFPEYGGISDQAEGGPPLPAPRSLPLLGLEGERSLGRLTPPHMTPSPGRAGWCCGESA